MLTMRSSSVTKMVKPPPPVPPRPSKTIVAEALAKRRRNPEDSYTIPVRSAPPPPLDLSGNQTNGRVNFSLKRPSSYERSISDELKSNSRTVVFQSSNIKNVNNSVLVRKDSINKVTLNNNFCNPVDNNALNNKLTGELKSEKKVKNGDTHLKNSVNSCDISMINADNSITIKQMDKSFQKSSESVDASADEVTVNSENIVTILTTKITPEKPGILRNSEGIIEAKTGGFFEEKNENKRDSFDEKWEEMLKDKNHVNMLIDEMFSSVLEVSKNEDLDKHITCETITAVSTDTTTIMISGCDKECESSDANGSTLLIVENDGDQKNDKHPLSNGTSSKGNSLTKIGRSTEKLDILYDKSNSSTMEKKNVHFDDKKNAELLIEELESMRVEQERILKRQRKPSQEIYDTVNGVECDKEEKMENCHINIVNLNAEEKGVTLDYERLKVMSSLHGLPPLPKSLSGFNLNENFTNPPTPARTTSMRAHQGSPSSIAHMMYTPHASQNGGSELAPSASGRKLTNLDTQLAILRREMYSLRQLDLSLLSQLWSLNESIQDFRQILQEQEDCRVLSPPSPSPSPSSGDEGDGEEQYYVNTTPSMKFRPAPPPPPTARKSSNSSNASTGG